MKSQPLKVLSLDHINMRVKHLEQSIDFYRRNFGFELKEDHRDDPDEPWAIVGLAQVAYLCMYEHPDVDIPVDALTINHFGLAIYDFDRAMEILGANGVEVLYGGPVGWPNSRSIYVKDPSGHEIELSEKFGGDLG